MKQLKPYCEGCKYVYQAKKNANRLLKGEYYCISSGKPRAIRKTMCANKIDFYRQKASKAHKDKPPKEPKKYVYNLATKDEIQEILSMRRQGKSCQEIADWIGVGKNTVMYHCRKHRVSLKEGIKHSNCWTKSDDEKLIRMYSEGANLVEVGKLFGRSEQAIRQRILILRTSGRQIAYRSKKISDSLFKHYRLLNKQ